MGNVLYIDSDEYIKFTNKLEKLGRADLPVAIRATINNLAFEMKGNKGKRGEIDKKAESGFTYRRDKNLFKAMTGVSKATGLKIAKMSSKAGIINRSGKGELAEGLADHQKGGDTDQKATPLSTARTGKSIGKKVRSANRLSKLNAINVRNKKGKQFMRLIIKAKKENKLLIVNGKRGDALIARIGLMKRKKDGYNIKLQYLYRFNKSGKVNIKRTPYINNAAKEVMKMGPAEFEKQAKRRIDKSFK